MRQALVLHPDGACGSVTAIAVDVARPRAGTLALGFVVSGAMENLYWPEPAAPARADGLWRRTCFEAFLQAGPGRNYLEFNFSPSRQWAGYAFSDYRTAMRPLTGIAPARILARRGTGYGELEVLMELGALEADSTAAWRLGLAAVIEEADGRLSWWALAHRPGRPDFHHRDGFVVELSPERS